MSDTLIKVEGLYKKFCRSLRRSMWYGTVDATRSMIGFPVKEEKLRKSEFWALQDINFELKRGECLGLIGQNGCGKSTLLRLINGIFPPDKGRITINGRIGALIAVGAGFHPHMTGRENIFLNGTILGMTKAELKRKFDEIVDFAEIGEFIDAPVATYSSGMTVRLGFAIAIHCEPDILLIDEVLAVGDMSFRHKCYNAIYEQQKKTAVVFVSHQMQHISRTCNVVCLMDKGKIVQYSDDIPMVINSYQNSCTKENIGSEEKVDSINVKNIKIKEGTVEKNIYEYGQKFEGSFEIKIPKSINQFFVSVSIQSSAIELVGNSTSEFENIIFNNAGKINRINFCIDNLYLGSGTYYLSIIVRDIKNDMLYWNHTFYKFSVKHKTHFLPAFYQPKTTWKHEQL